MNPETPPLVALRDASHRYGPVVAFAPLSVSVASGELVCVTGPPGSGKTTLLHVIGGLIEATTGQIERAGPVAVFVSTIDAEGDPVCPALVEPVEPLVVIADDPTPWMPQRDAARVRRQLRALADDGHAVVVATHDRALVAMSDREIQLVSAT